MALGIRGRLSLLAVVITACVTLLASVAWMSIQETRVFGPIYNQQEEDLNLLADIIPPGANAMEIYLESHRYGDFEPSERPKIMEHIKELRANFEALWGKWIAASPSDVLTQRRTSARDTGRDVIDKIYTLIGMVDHNNTDKELDEQRKLIDKGYITHRAAIEKITIATNERIGQRKKILEENDRDAKNKMTTAIIFTVFSILAGCWLIARSIVRPITRVVEQLGSGADQVTTASSEVSAGAQRIAQGASEQAASLEETTASLEELSATCGQNANNARQANALASEAANASEAGETAARRAASEVLAQMQELSKAIEAIRTSTEKTTQVVESIDDIAIQINLLALNAAVEAARAGEAGLGFAVVADEVRNLAARSTEEAKNTSALIRESRANTERVQQVSRGVQEYLSKTLEQDVVNNFQKLVTIVRKVAQLNAEVAASSDEQSRGVGQINAAVAQMDKVTQENAASAEESAASSEEMQGQAMSLREGVNELRTVVGVKKISNKKSSDNHHHDIMGATRESLAQFPPISNRANSHTDPAARPHKTGDRKAAQVLPLTDDEAKDHKGDFSKF